ncbi:hypothetical protein [Kitasatospora sp. KL5]|uniref:hypothetical protein n=1 Tax=Kitasatospora sp. KL5 TaxID=3425125 RepID=UPI003D700862
MAQKPAAETAEIKISFAGTEAAAAAGALVLDPDRGRRRRLHFWERLDGRPASGPAATPPALPLLERGVVLRLRRDTSANGGAAEADLTVKLRPCPALPRRWQTADRGKHWEYAVEEDLTGPAYQAVTAASLRIELSPAEARRAEHSPVRRTLTGRQHQLLEHAGVTGDDLRGLTALGPVDTVKWELRWSEVAEPVAVEEWTTRTNLRFLELSVRTGADAAADVQAQLARALLARNVPLPQFGQTKTRAVLIALAACP